MASSGWVETDLKRRYDEFVSEVFLARLIAQLIGPVIHRTKPGSDDRMNDVYSTGA